MRKFVQGTPRDLNDVCGNCWPWPKTIAPMYQEATDEEMQEVRKMLQKV